MEVFSDDKLNVALQLFTKRQNFRLFQIESFFQKINLNETLKIYFGKGSKKIWEKEKMLEENIVGKGENAGYQHLRLFPQSFQKTSVSGSLKVWTV